jgi:hypothetical protein
MSLNKKLPMKQYKNSILIALFALLLLNTPGFSQEQVVNKKQPKKKKY